MKNHYKEDREYLKALCEVLEVSERNLKRDDYENCVLVGRRGIICTDTEDWYVYFSVTGRKWTEIKKKLTWMDLTQDGDDEGIMRSNLCMSKKQTEEVRKLVGLTHTPPMSEKKKEVVFKMRKALQKRGFSRSQSDLND